MIFNSQKVTTFGIFGIFLKIKKFFEQRLIKGLNKIGLLSVRNGDAASDAGFTTFFIQL